MPKRNRDAEDSSVAAVIGSCQVERHVIRHLASLGLRVGPQLFDGNADGVGNFHAKCDNQGLTLTLALTSQGPVAGIQSFTGATGAWVSQDDAAIITKSGVYQPTAGVQCAAYQSPSHLPTWGAGHSLHLGKIAVHTTPVPYAGAHMRAHAASAYNQPEVYDANNFVVQNVVVFKLLVGVKSDISKHLHANGHFPVDEIQLLSATVELEAYAHDAFSGASATVEQINCPTLDSTKGLAAYCSNVPAALRSLKRVVACGKEKSDTASTIAAVVNNLKLVFSKVDGASAPHTLILRSVSSDLVCAVVDAQLAQLARLVLESSSVDLDNLLPLVAKNNHLEELCFEPYAFQLGSDTLALAQQCPHISFNTKLDLSVPPPKAAATIQSKPLQEAMKLGAFNKLCKEKAAAKLEPPIALATASWGQVVPLDRQLVPRFQLLQAMLQDCNNDADEGEENLVHWEMKPPVSKESVALAVHFVTHHVTDEVERECARAEELRGNGAGDGAPVAGGGGGQDRDAGGAATHTWCAEFAQFRTIFIQQRYARGARVHVMCELMAIACYFNCPSLKRFLRAALVMEEHEDSEEA